MCAGVHAGMRGRFLLWVRPLEPMTAHRFAAGAAARACGARQVDLLHEGEGAPGVARAVQALGDPVRPAAGPPPCALTVVPALRCCVCVPRRALGRTTRR
jgi:hypothetical protein